MKGWEALSRFRPRRCPGRGNVLRRSEAGPHPEAGPLGHHRGREPRRRALDIEIALRR